MGRGFGLVIVREPREATVESVRKLTRTTGEGGVHPVVIDGKDCADEAALFGTLAEKLAFPDYFGRNWDALDECFSDLLEITGGGLGSAFADRPGVAARTLILTFLDSARLIDNGADLLTKLLATFDHAVDVNRERNAAGLRVILQLDAAESDETEAALRRITEGPAGG
ncbi:barstar family protein [Pseudonocardia spinosispora]|uniref:barstar family protein n=1 Tax=Pseudonocardia spinosispora TaxID=103441 RepID=UPI000A0413EB|nr:barstar family protein [Pseudonocardia spinosispora]